MRRFEFVAAVVLRNRVARRLFLASGVCFGGWSATSARAADYEIVASGPLEYMLHFSQAFDGRTRTTLPLLIDADRVQGGSFRATFRFSTVTPEPGATAVYQLSPPSGWTFELLDSAGQVVHQGGSPSRSGADLENNNLAPTRDRVTLYSFDDTVTGLHVPTPLYGGSPGALSRVNIDVNGEVRDGVDYISDLSIPTQASTYLAFPLASRSFGVFVNFQDGDAINQIRPFQTVWSIAHYTLTELTVTAVPEPTALALAMVAGIGLLPRRGRPRR